MSTLTLQPLIHRGSEQIALFFKQSVQLNNCAKKIKNIKWSKSHHCWYLPMNEENYNLILHSFGKLARIDTAALKAYLEKRKLAAASLVHIHKPEEHMAIKPVTAIVASSLSAANLLALSKFVEYLKLKAYSTSTIQTYRNEFMQLLQKLGSKHVDELSPDQLKRYMVYAMEHGGISENTAHSRLNALKFYFEQVLGRERFFWEIPRPKKRKLLPKVFSQDEIASIINTVKNRKHKTMLMLAYSAGLRISELVSLKTSDIDSKRMTIFISQAKGKKDRMVALSPVLLVMLREYAMEYKPVKNGYLFEGSSKGSPYSPRSLQEVLQAAKKKAGIIRPGSIHSLRHSFATHLIDKGTDVTMIQKLLGHNDIKTTLRYLHTSNKDLLRIISPLDDLNLT
jgi:site-specific recombinase XerD